MRSFEYARPQTEAEAVALLNDHDSETTVLAGGTDLMNLLRRDLVGPKRVVDIKQVESMRGIRPIDDGVLIGALATLEDVASNPLTADYRSLLDVVDGTRAIQIQANGTIGGDLCHLPNCWYFRNGYGLLGYDNGESLVQAGDNRYHAILGNAGPAKFVSASRFAPAMIAWGARVRVIGPEPDAEEYLPLEYFYITPRLSSQGVTVLKPGQMISHLWLPSAGRKRSATYEVLQMEGLDWPLASASVSVEMDGDIVRDASIVLGHVAPTPWLSREAAKQAVGRPLNERSASEIGDLAVATATPLSNNAYKVQLARTAVKRALLKAVDKLEGGL